MQLRRCAICRLLALPEQGLHGATGNHWECEERAREAVLLDGEQVLARARALLAELELRYK